MSLFLIIGTTVNKTYTAQETLLHESLKNKAIAIFDLIVDMRHWNAAYDGVYLKTEKLAPNPYLKPNFIRSDKNETLVWVNPAFMTRQISDIASRRDGFKLKITSDKLINKHNAPDEDEKKILEYFRSNPDAKYYWNIKENDFRFMGALRTEKECLVCHKKQGYKVGDIRGGISVIFDISEESKQLGAISRDREQTILFLLIASIGAILTLIIHQRIKYADEKKISSLNTSLEAKVTELDEFNQTLHNRVREEVEKQREKENLLIRQSRLAALGEMIGNIAHQWRQPISAVSAIMMNIKWTAIANGVDREFLDRHMDEANEQLGYMSRTIDDFSNFFKPNKEKEEFDLTAEVKRACNILEATLQNRNIRLLLDSEEGLVTYGYPNEFSQVILNLVSNAKDVLIERATPNPQIDIRLYRREESLCCEISDNAGGISREYLDKIFEPYFTTKESGGTGIGLHISQEIIRKHMHGTLNAHNSDRGATFVITIPITRSPDATSRTAQK